MPKIKEVPCAEVHWQVSSWNVRDAANNRIRQYLADDAQYFAPVYVTHSSYYWSDPGAEGWTKLTIADEKDQLAARMMISQMKQRALQRIPDKSAILDQVFSFPNDDFIFVRHDADGKLQLRLTGWGFANYRRGTAGTIIDTSIDNKINEISVCFSIDGERMPNRPFRRLQGTAWVEEKTDESGIFSFGKIPAGNEISVVDIPTGTERITRLTENTTLIDIDVTEMVNYRIVARFDDTPVSGENVTVRYRHRKAQIPLQFGAAGGILPWFEGVECEVTFRDQTQRRPLYKDSNNEFVFDLHTPHQARTSVRVTVVGDGAPIAGEKVSISTPAGVQTLVTGAEGTVALSFDTPEEGFNIVAKVREKEESRPAIDGSVDIPFEFNTPPPVHFDGYVRAVNLSGNPIARYPLTLDLGDGAGTGSFLTDDKGLVGPYHMTGGNTMTVWDGANPNYFATYLLNPMEEEYVFELPLKDTPHRGDMTLRVVCLGNRPAAGVNCILRQNDTVTSTILNPAGQMTFGSDIYMVPGPVQAELYSPERQFPKVPFTLEKDENDYELIEVAGPQPWWKTAGEIALAGGALLALTAGYFVLQKVLFSLPCFF